MRNKIFFSIIIPTFNRSELLLKTIRSLQKIKSEEFEILVVDDGGTDNTREEIERLHDFRIAYFYKDNEERGAARNYGAGKAKGEYLNFFDSDDIAYPEHLLLAKEFIEQNKAPEVFALSYEICNSEGKTLQKKVLKRSVPDFIFEGNHLSCNGVFIQRKTAKKYPFNEDRQLAGSEDFELWLRLAARFPFPVSGKISHRVIQHEDRSTLNYKAGTLINRKMKMLEYAFGDKAVIKKFGKYKNLMVANAYRYISLHLVLAGDKKLSLKYLLKALQKQPSQLLNKTNFAILKRWFF